MSRSWSLLDRLALATAALCLVLMALRVGSALSFAIPLHVVTSGTEHGPLYTIWKAVNGLSIASDRHNFPYDSTVYNWIFYRLYGLATGQALSILHLDEEWLPTIARLLTLSAFLPMVLAARHAIGLAGGSFEAEGRPAWAVAILLSAGPLVGFWVVTARPDYWATLIEILAIIAFWRLEAEGKRKRAVFAFALLALLAWSLKQTNIFALAGMGLFLLLRLRWVDLALLCATSVGGWAITLSIGGPDFARNLFFVGIPLNYQLLHPFVVFKSFLLKALPILAFLLAGILLTLRDTSLRLQWVKDERLFFSLCGLAASLLLAFMTSIQEGSAENYYFTPSVFAALAGFRLMSLLGSRPFPIWAQGLQAGGWAGLGLAMLLVLSGQAGALSVRPQHDIFTAQRQCLEPLTPPYYVKDDYLSLPWMAKGNPPIALSYSYYDERRVGNAFQHGGLGGLIEQGFFTTLVFVAQTLPEELDGAKLTGYIPRPGACAGMLFMDRAGGSRP